MREGTNHGQAPPEQGIFPNAVTYIYKWIHTPVVFDHMMVWPLSFALLVLATSALAQQVIKIGVNSSEIIYGGTWTPHADYVETPSGFLYLVGRGEYLQVP